MKIILIRHGRLDWDFDTPVRGREFCEWMRGQDAAPLEPGQRPSPEAERLVRNAACTVTSPLRRSVDSAQVLAPGVQPISDARFHEAELPCAFRSGLRLAPWFWAFLARSAWFFGWSAWVEGFRAARHRAADAAQRLATLAQSHGTIAHVGHGLMHILIAHYLRKARWRGPRFRVWRHWGFAEYYLKDTTRSV